MRLVLLPLLALVACGEPVRTGYEATIVGAVDGGFGLSDDDVWKSVSGSFSWHTANLDSDPTDERGVYRHPGDGDFELTLPNGVVVEGSGYAEVQVVFANAIVFSDAADLGGQGTAMFVDGEFNDDVSLTIQMQHATTVLSDDRLPTVFPDLEAKNWTTELLNPEDNSVLIAGNGGSTSFRLSDATGSVELQFTSLSDQSP